MGTADAPVLWESDSWPRKEPGSFDLTDRRVNKLAKLLPLLFGDRSQQVLNLRDAFPHKRHNGDVGDARDPGVADELKVKRGQSVGLVRVTSARSLPLANTNAVISPELLQQANSLP